MMLAWFDGIVLFEVPVVCTAAKGGDGWPTCGALQSQASHNTDARPMILRLEHQA
jgi:hypothetical protein